MGAKQHYHLYYCLLPKVYHRELCCYVKQILSIEIITLVLIGTVLPSLDGGGGMAVDNDRSLEEYPYRWMKSWGMERAPLQRFGTRMGFVLFASGCAFCEVVSKVPRILTS